MVSIHLLHGPSKRHICLARAGSGLALGVLLSLGPIVSSCGSAHAGSNSLAGTWNGEWYNSTAGVPYTLSLHEGSRDRLEGTMYVDGRRPSYSVHGSIIHDRITLALPNGSVMNGPYHRGQWTGSFSDGGIRWHFRFVRRSRA